MNKLKEYLKPYESVLAQARISSFPGLARLQGQFEGYNAVFGLGTIRGTEFSFEGWLVYYEIKLKQKIKVPFFVWDRFHIEGYEDIILYRGKLLRINDFLPYSFMSFRSDKLDGYFCAQSYESIKNKFLRLLEVVHKIENNQISFKKSFERERKRFIRNILLAIIILPICWLVYILLGWLWIIR